MKMRNDFVSNSSSCSFIINDVKKFLDIIIDRFGKEEMSYEYEFANVFVKANLDDEKWLKKYARNNSYGLMVSVHDGFCYATTSISDLFKMTSDEIDKIISIELESYDFEMSSLFKLSLLKKVCDELGIAASSDVSDHSLMFEDNDPTIIEKMMEIAFKISRKVDL